MMETSKNNILNILELTKRRLLIFVLGVTLSLFSGNVWANNLVINNFGVDTINESANQITFQCDVSWDNAWRSTTNYDAVWVFMKYSTDGGLTWSHASMGANGVNPSGFSAPSAFEIVVPSDEKGFFFQKSELSFGTASASGVKFVWDYAQDGLSDSVAMAASTINKVYGIEMVYVPQGSFYAGDGNSSSDYRFKQGSTDNDAWYIESENAFSTTASSSDGFYYQSSGSSGEAPSGSIFLIPTSFPKGYQSAYQMKYELTEGQWVGFFNSLTPTQKTSRDITSATQGGKNSDLVVDRNTVSWDSADSISDAVTSRPDRPVSYISWPDLLAYADWAALRPLTELEFEKSARGADIGVVANEYVWGTISSNDALAGEIYPNSDEDGTRQISDGGSNLNRNSLSWSSGDGRVGGAAQGQRGPLRAGIFAELSTNRVTSGAGFYGSMELSGNLHEMFVTVGRLEGLAYLGTHGDGLLSTVSSYEGNATNPDWPGINATDSARGVTGTLGSGYRGGDFQSSSIRYFQVSTRFYAVKDADSLGYAQRYDASSGIYQGGRLGRTAP